MKKMALSLLVVLLCATPFALATQEVLAPHVHVLYNSPQLADYAQRVANEAERALTVLLPLFGVHPGIITIQIADDTDIYNAETSVVPRPKVALRALFPTADVTGFRAKDQLYLLLIHELTHAVQLTYTARPPGSAPPLKLGLVGENAAAVPPSWFLEGIAVWTESHFTSGGRLDDALSVGLRQSAALAGNWPSLSSASVITYAPWPGGMTRYLFGAGFIDYLVQKYGFTAIVKTLQRYNAEGFLGTFSDAWQRAVGSDLNDEWTAWKSEVKQKAQMRAKTTAAVTPLTDTDWYTRAPALSPDGKMLAYTRWPPAIAVSEVGPDGTLHDSRTLIKNRLPDKLSWLDKHTLVYARGVPRPGSDYGELFSLDVGTGKETQLTSGARASLATAAPGGCIDFARDVPPQASKLQEWCAGHIKTLWRAPPGEHIVGLAVSASSRIALSVWREGFTDLALLQNGRATMLTQDAAQDLDPAWDDEDTLVFRSDREGGVFNLFLEPKPRKSSILDLGSPITQLTHSLGGAFQPTVGPKGIWYAVLGGDGFNIAYVPNTAAPSVNEPVALGPVPKRKLSHQHFAVRPYSPLSSLLPYGWLPTGGNFSLNPLGFAVSAAVLGQDDSGHYSYALNLGYDSRLRGLLGGAYANLRFDVNAGTLFTSFAVPQPLSFGFQIGLWPHQPHLEPLTETALGVQGSLTATLPEDIWTSQLYLRLGMLKLPASSWQLDALTQATLSNQHTDDWGYPTNGLHLSLTGAWSASESGPAPGLWADGAYVQPLPFGTLTFGLTAGYRPKQPIPISLNSDFGATFSAGYRASVPIHWRYGDGRYALERLTLEPTARAWLGANLHLGGDLGVWADTVLDYGAPVSFGGTVGYAQGWWYALGVKLPL
jgi:hypothetical protein